MAYASKSNAPRRPSPAAKERAPDAPIVANVSGSTAAALRMVPAPPPPDPEVRERAADNPFSEAHFKTLKYRPEFPDRFDTIEAARAFCQPFFT
jgi:hypothetical protein